MSTFLLMCTFIHGCDVTFIRKCFTGILYVWTLPKLSRTLLFGLTLITKTVSFI